MPIIDPPHHGQPWHESTTTPFSFSTAGPDYRLMALDYAVKIHIGSGSIMGAEDAVRDAKLFYAFLTGEASA